MRLYPVDYNGLDLRTYNAYFINPYGFSLPPQASVTLAPRLGDFPLYGDKELQQYVFQVKITIEHCTPEIRNRLTKFINTGDRALHTLTAWDADSNRDWTIEANVLGMETRDDTGTDWTATFLAANPVWRSGDLLTANGNLNATGQSVSAAPGGNQYARPVIRITPTAGKPGGFTYQRWIRIYNQTIRSFTNYPFNVVGTVLDTQALIAAGKMQIAGNDLRIYINGVEADRWLDGINTVNTKVWINFNLSAKQEFTLKTAIAGAGAVSQIEVNEDISAMPNEGTLLIDNEAFTYTSKNITTRIFNGTVTRSAKFTAAAVHAIGATVRWIEHDVWMYYGDAALAAPTPDDTCRPILNMNTSTNLSWDYDDFRDTATLRSGIWSPSGTIIYTADHGGIADPASEMGIKQHTWTFSETGLWQIYQPAGITNWNFANGEKMRTGAYWFEACALQRSNDGSSWTTEYGIPTPAASGTWEAWNDNRALGATSLYARLYGNQKPNMPLAVYVEVSDVTLTLSASGIPSVSLGAENSQYQLNCRLTNTATDEYIELVWAMSLNYALEIDTEASTITYLKDNSNAFAALKPIDPPRQDWLYLLDGQANAIRYDETGMTGVTLSLEWYDRNN